MRDFIIKLAQQSTAEVEHNNWKYYYQVNDYKFNNAYLANWFEREFNCWATYVAQQFPQLKHTIESGTYNHSVNYTLDHLKKLRNKNTNLQLFFSGGVDSLSILETAINNDIFIDELVVVATGNRLKSLENKEIYTSAIPLAEKYKGKYGKLTVKQTNLQSYKKIYSDPFSLIKLPESGSCYPIYRRMWNNLNLDAGTKIFGPEKPQLLHYNNKWYSVMLDSSLNGFYAVDPGATYFNYEPEGIYALVKDSINYRNFLLQNNLVKSGNIHFYKPTTNKENLSINKPLLPKNSKSYIKHFSRGPNIWNFKDQYALLDTVKSQELELLCLYYGAIDTMLKIYPNYNFNEKNLSPMKFGWFIDIDNFKIYTQNELIPNGFKNEMD